MKQVLSYFAPAVLYSKNGIRTNVKFQVVLSKLIEQLHYIAVVAKPALCMSHIL